MSFTDEVPHRAVIKEVPSGQIVMEVGADGVFLRFECECVDALPYCKSACCALHGIDVEEDEIDQVERAASAQNLYNCDDPNRKFQLPVVIRNDDDEPTMRRGSDSWCVAIDRKTKACRIYEDRPKTCRDFHCTNAAGMRGWRLDILRQYEDMDD